LAQFDDDSIVVYQAYNETIAAYAVQHQKFEGCPAFNTTRMTWVKTNFLWMHVSMRLGRQVESGARARHLAEARGV
jgi:hypothetical protein